MPILYVCPYYIYEKGNQLSCELLKLKFPDKQARRDIVYGMCAHPTNYEDCPFKKALDGYYVRKYEEERKGRRS